jgi:hypothetical protein
METAMRLDMHSEELIQECRRYRLKLKWRLYKAKRRESGIVGTRSPRGRGRGRGRRTSLSARHSHNNSSEEEEEEARGVLHLSDDPQFELADIPQDDIFHDEEMNKVLADMCSSGAHVLMRESHQLGQSEVLAPLQDQEDIEEHHYQQETTLSFPPVGSAQAVASAPLEGQAQDSALAASAMATFQEEEVFIQLVEDIPNQEFSD